MHKLIAATLVVALSEVGHAAESKGHGHGQLLGVDEFLDSLFGRTFGGKTKKEPEEATTTPEPYYYPKNRFDCRNRTLLEQMNLKRFDTTGKSKWRIASGQ